jgi:hypothetical protein
MALERELQNAGGKAVRKAEIPSGFSPVWAKAVRRFPIAGAHHIISFTQIEKCRRFHELFDVDDTIAQTAAGFVVGSVDGGSVVLVDDAVWFVDFLDGRETEFPMASGPEEFLTLLQALLTMRSPETPWAAFAGLVPRHLIEGWSYFEIYFRSE